MSRFIQSVKGRTGSGSAKGSVTPGLAFIGQALGRAPALEHGQWSAAKLPVVAGEGKYHLRQVRRGEGLARGRPNAAT